MENYSFRGVVKDICMIYLENRMLVSFMIILSLILVILILMFLEVLFWVFYFLIYYLMIYILFNYFILILFADDINLIFKDKDANTLKLTMNNELNKLNIWLSENKLTFIIDKSSYSSIHDTFNDNNYINNVVYL